MVLIIMVSDELGITSFVSTCCNRENKAKLIWWVDGWMDAVMKIDIPIVM